VNVFPCQGGADRRSIICIILSGAEARAALQAERDTLSRQLAAAEQARESGQSAQESLRTELEVALRRAERALAEATATRRLVAGKRRAPATRTKFKPGST
jgi:F0F1-type ATP synthase membrane subunit b/b'